MMRAMYCSRCGAPLVPDAVFCAKCGAAAVPPPAPAPPPFQPGPSSIFATPSPATASVVIKRPAIITVLAVLHFIGGAFWVLMGLGALAAPASSGPDAAAVLLIAPMFAGIGVAQVFCGLGLLRLKPYGRTLQLVFAWIGLIGIPIGTIISVLILIYFFKPGIKLIFAGRPGDDFTPQEAAEIQADTAASSATIVILVVVGVLAMIAVVGVIAALTVPAFSRARAAGNEAGAIMSLRAINQAEAAYAAMCAQGGYAVALRDLAWPPAGTSTGFISEDLARSDVEKSGYRITLTRDRSPDTTDVGTAAATCNGSLGQPASSYFATAEPVTPGVSGMRYFAVDARGTIVQSMQPISNPIVFSAGIEPIR